MKKSILIITIFAIFGYGLTSMFQKKLPLLKIGASYQAKNYCSCRFIEEQDHEYCANAVADLQLPQWLMNISTDKESKVVTAGRWAFAQQAKYEDPQLGCSYVF